MTSRDSMTVPLTRGSRTTKVANEFIVESVIALVSKNNQLIEENEELQRNMSEVLDSQKKYEERIAELEVALNDMTIDRAEMRQSYSKLSEDNKTLIADHRLSIVKYNDLKRDRDRLVSSFELISSVNDQKHTQIEELLKEQKERNELCSALGVLIYKFNHDVQNKLSIRKIGDIQDDK